MDKKLIFGICILSLLVLYGCGEASYTTDNSDSKSQPVKRAQLEVEIGELGSTGMLFRVINRNDYDWHNVKITVNDYYSCWERDVLKPGAPITVNAATCNQFAVNQNMVYSVQVETDEGFEEFSR